MIVIGHGLGMTRGGVGTELHGYRGLGFAVVTYDQRGYGASEGSTDAGFELSASDVRVLIDHVLELPWVDRAALGLSARSRGAWIAPLVVRDDPRVRFVVALVPPVRGVAEILVTSRLDQLARTGRSREELALAGRALAALCERARGRVDWPTYDAIRRKAVAHPWAEVLGLPDSEEHALWPWLARNVDYDPFPEWRFVEQPVLGIFAGADLDVEPHANAALLAAACSDVAVEIRPGIGHELEPVAPREGDARGPDPGVWDSVGDWLSRRDLLPLHESGPFLGR
jgi:alpha-beta hydrolase superfamily lysophospholipase